MSNKPIPIQPEFANIPAELRSLPNWVNWRYLPPKSSGGKWPKVPFGPNGKPANTTDRSTWSSYDACCAAYTRGGFDGIGFVFDGAIGPDGLCYCGIDLDACVIDGKVQSLAMARIKHLNTYTECSVSGTGFHCITRAAPLKRIVKFDGVEIYTRARYFTFTGRALGRIKTAPNETRALVDQIRAKESAAKKQRSGATKDDRVETAHWFDTLSPEQRDDVVDHALSIIAKSTPLLELGINGGNNSEYFKLTTSVARSGAPNAEDIFVKHASRAEDADSEEELRRHFARCGASSTSGDQPITVGTLLLLAQQNGATFHTWNSQADGAADQTNDAVWPDWPDPLDFHRVPVQEAIARVNAAGYFVLTLNGDIYKVEPGGGVIVQKREGFNNLFACRMALLDKVNEDKSKANEDKSKVNEDKSKVNENKAISAGDAWKRSPLRREYDGIGYWPGGYHCPAKSYNLWQGWGIEPTQGDWSVINDHVLNVLACGDRAKSDYILDWCAHMVQRPWEKPGVALVFRGGKGTGKTLLTLLVATAIGRRNALITASGKKLFGTFNWQLADKLLIGAEEAFFVGNRELTDQLKHLLTGDEIEVEQKFGQRISMKSMHRMIMTSNHEQVIQASDDERRFFVCDVSETRRGDDVYFAPLVAVTKGEDKNTLAAFMHELQTRDINNWKPERAAREAARGGSDLARQKLLSLEPPLQWLLESTLSQSDPVSQTEADTGLPCDHDLTSVREQERAHMLLSYRQWVKTAQVRGASDHTGAETFWNSIKRLLNDEIFAGRRLFRSSGGTRWVILPPKQEMLDGFNRLLGGKVIDADEDE